MITLQLHEKYVRGIKGPVGREGGRGNLSMRKTYPGRLINIQTGITHTMTKNTDEDA